MRKVSVLGVDARSNYRLIPGLELFDVRRDMRTFKGGTPVIAHPPCAQWSRSRNLARVDLEEKALGDFCIEVVRANGGVLEHPAGSSLFRGLPPPGGRDAYGLTMVVDQCWFGFRARKRTLLYLVGVEVPPYPLSLAKPVLTVGGMHSSVRSRCPLGFCTWLVEMARTVHPYLSCTVLGDRLKTEKGEHGSI